MVNRAAAGFGPAGMVYGALSRGWFSRTTSSLKAPAVTASIPHDPPHHHAAHLATMVRTRLKRPAPPLPRADAALLKAAAMILLAGAAATGIALFGIRKDEDAANLVQPSR